MYMNTLNRYLHIFPQQTLNPSRLYEIVEHLYPLGKVTSAWHTTLT